MHLTAEQLAEELNVNPETIRRKTREGKIPHIRLDASVRYDLAEVKRFLSPPTITEAGVYNAPVTFMPVPDGFWGIGERRDGAGTFRKQLAVMRVSQQAKFVKIEFITPFGEVWPDIEFPDGGVLEKGHFHFSSIEDFLGRHAREAALMEEHREWCAEQLAELKC